MGAHYVRTYVNCPHLYTKTSVHCLNIIDCGKISSLHQTEKVHQHNMMIIIFAKPHLKRFCYHRLFHWQNIFKDLLFKEFVLPRLRQTHSWRNFRLESLKVMISISDDEVLKSNSEVKLKQKTFFVRLWLYQTLGIKVIQWKIQIVFYCVYFSTL